MFHRTRNQQKAELTTYRCFVHEKRMCTSVAAIKQISFLNISRPVFSYLAICGIHRCTKFKTEAK